MSKGREFESQYRILDVHFSHLFAVKLYCVFERTKINEKEAGVGPFLKKELTCSIDLWRGFPSVPPPSYLCPPSVCCVLCATGFLHPTPCAYLYPLVHLLIFM